MRNFLKFFAIYLGLIIGFLVLLKGEGVPDSLFSSLRSTELFYGIYYGPFKIGECKITITSRKYEAIVYSVGLGKIFFPFYAKWDTWVDKEGYPLKVLIYSRERGKERKKLIKFNKKQNTVFYQKLLPKKKKPEVISIDFPVYDELSSFIKAISIDYYYVNKTALPVYIKKSRDFIILKAERETACKIGKEEKKCIKVLIHLPEKSELLKRTSQIEMKILKREKYPVELKGKLPLLGHLVGKLQKISYLDYAKVISSSKEGI